ncbi:hypothetical protein BJY00DRAFT_283992 [Aspergillus carlsbadensis]|nr:hypothetical protein BJY00DRAFT_283992 [Aspergillus carlsbadensis]
MDNRASKIIHLPTMTHPSDKGDGEERRAKATVGLDSTFPSTTPTFEEIAEIVTSIPGWRLGLPIQVLGATFWCEKYAPIVAHWYPAVLI